MYLVNFDEISHIANITFLGAGYFYICVNVFVLFWDSVKLPGNSSVIWVFILRLVRQD